MTSRNRIQLAKRIDRLIAKWLRATGRDEARAKDVMPLLIQNEVFRRDHRQGLPLRKLLRDLQRSGDLSVMRTVRPERKNKNTLWYFTLREPVGPVEPGPEGESPPRKRRRPVKPRESPGSSSEGHRTVLLWRGRRIETLADIVDVNLRILFVGLNPSPISVARGHYHQGRLGQGFWRLLVEHGVLPAPDPGRFHDDLLLRYRMGITDLVKVPSRRANSLDPADVSEGRTILRRKIAELRPQIVCSVYKRALEELGEIRLTNRWGLVGETLGDSRLFVLPFPYRSHALGRAHMGQLRKLLRQAES